MKENMKENMEAMLNDIVKFWGTNVINNNDLSKNLDKCRKMIKLPSLWTDDVNQIKHTTFEDEEIYQMNLAGYTKDQIEITQKEISDSLYELQIIAYKEDSLFGSSEVCYKISTKINSDEEIKISLENGILTLIHKSYIETERNKIRISF